MKRIVQVCLLIAAIAIPAHLVYAYFTDYEAARGGAVISLLGRTELEEEATDAQKTLSVKNTGDSNVLVRVKAFGDFIASEEPSEDWTHGSDGFWYYNKILMPEGAVAPAGEEAYYTAGQTSDLVIKIDADAAKGAEHGFDIIVVQEAEIVVWNHEGSSESVIIPEGWETPAIVVSAE